MADPDVNTSDLAMEAALKALGMAGLTPGDLDLIILATIIAWPIVATAQVREKIDRGVVALTVNERAVYVGWRLLKNDPEDVAFNILRRVGTQRRQLNPAPLAKTTDFIDKTPVASEKNEYIVVPVVDGKAGEPSEAAAALPSNDGRDYVSIKLDGDPKKFEEFVSLLDTFDPWYQVVLPMGTK